MYVDNPNILILARKLELIPNVLQVRFYSPLRQYVHDIGGDGCMIFQMIVKDLTVTDDYSALRSLIPKAVIDDESLHPGVVDNITKMIERYQLTQEMPARLGHGGSNEMVNVITTASLFEQYQPEDIATPGSFPPL